MAIEVNLKEEEKTVDKLDEVNVRDFVEIESINLPDIQPKINGFAFSERGDTAFLENGECLVILTYKGEIQLNQTCNFVFTRPATIEEIVKLDKALRDQKALMIEDHRVKPWMPSINQCYEAVSFNGKAVAFTYYHNEIDSEFANCGNIFPVGFLTKEKRSQFLETVSKLFESWRE